MKDFTAVVKVMNPDGFVAALEVAKIYQIPKIFSILKKDDTLPNVGKVKIVFKQNALFIQCVQHCVPDEMCCHCPLHLSYPNSNE
jgi:hypothetical protein